MTLAAALLVDLGVEGLATWTPPDAPAAAVLAGFVILARAGVAGAAPLAARAQALAVHGDLDATGRLVAAWASGEPPAEVVDVWQAWLDRAVAARMPSRWIAERTAELAVLAEPVTPPGP